MTPEDWERDWPEAIDPETGEDPDGGFHPTFIRGDVEEDDWTADPQ